MQVLLTRFFSILFLVSLSFLVTACSPEKTSVSDYDMKRVLERFASARIQTGIASDLEKPAPSDQALFEEACDVYRLPKDKAKTYLKEKNSALFESIYGN